MLLNRNNTLCAHTHTNTLNTLRTAPPVIENERKKIINTQSALSRVTLSLLLASELYFFFVAAAVAHLNENRTKDPRLQ